MGARPARQGSVLLGHLLPVMMGMSAPPTRVILLQVVSSPTTLPLVTMGTPVPRPTPVVVGPVLALIRLPAPPQISVMMLAPVTQRPVSVPSLQRPTDLPVVMATPVPRTTAVRQGPARQGLLWWSMMGMSAPKTRAIQRQVSVTQRLRMGPLVVMGMPAMGLRPARAGHAKVGRH